MTVLTREIYDKRRIVLQRDVDDAEAAYAAAARAAAVGDGTDEALEEAEGVRSRGRAKLAAYDTAWAEQRRMDAQQAEQAIHDRWRRSEIELQELMVVAETEMEAEVAALVERTAAVVQRLSDTWGEASQIIDKHRVPKGGSHEALRSFNFSGRERAETASAALGALRDLGHMASSLALQARMALASVKPEAGLD